MMPSIDIIGNDRCTGCFGCQNSCVADAISMVLDDDGFYMPVVDRTKCTECGNCQKHCPVLSIPINNPDSFETAVFAARTVDVDLHKKSSSGGIFGELAKSIIERKGIVFGAAWDEKLNLSHQMVTTHSELQTLYGSKYLQSGTSNSYRIAVEEALNGREVLFCGTPCQIAALRTFLPDEQEVRERIYSCDLICHGVGSSRFFQQYVSHMCKKFGGTVRQFTFRSKRSGWLDYSVGILFDNGKRYRKSHRYDPYMVGYLKNLHLRSSCFHCPFSCLPRSGDISLGDLWGGGQHTYDHFGLSAVLINNNHGLSLFNSVTQTGKVKMRVYKLSEAIQGNIRISSGNMDIPSQRSTFLEEIKMISFEQIHEKYLKKRITAGYVILKLRQYYLRLMAHGV